MTFKTFVDLSGWMAALLILGSQLAPAVARPA